MRRALLTLGILFFSNVLFGQFWEQQIISTNADGAYKVFPADFNNDGFMDVLSLSSIDDEIKWYKNLDGFGNFSNEIIITQNPASFISFNIVDLDTDGDMDLLYLENNPRKLAWLENTDGEGNFSSEQVILENQTDFIMSSLPVDIDNDGDLDLLLEFWNSFVDRFVWFENLDGLGNFGDETILIDNNLNYIPPLFVDIDSDGLKDILTSTDEYEPARIIWFKNLGNATFSPEQEIYQFEVLVSDWTSVYSIDFVDITTDGKNDLVVETHHDDFGTFVEWFENLDGQGSFEQKGLLGIPRNYSFFDIDNDGDLDNLSRDYIVNEIFWIENVDGLGNFETVRVISNKVEAISHVNASDLNGDGLLDVLSASSGDDKVAWYENTGIFGIPDNTENAIEVYPNPVNEKLFFTSKETISVVDIFDSLGGNLGTYINTNEVNFSVFASGIYFIKITLDNGATQVKKVLKR